MGHPELPGAPGTFRIQVTPGCELLSGSGKTAKRGSGKTHTFAKERECEGHPARSANLRLPAPPALQFRRLLSGGAPSGRLLLLSMVRMRSATIFELLTSIYKTQFVAPNCAGVSTSHSVGEPCLRVRP